eukprot:TRINITY_DN13751_c0_g1_i3.p1 TRINITY_DN13751_c0_g1~~TRINITY_DN13751_c0_g1_i3.p1  ORF type:complete len:177 (-),score=15.66 TRINITY_DN13751_c0_g1_i3:37-543(-)
MGLQDLSNFQHIGDIESTKQLPPLDKSLPMLVLGCGNSELSFDFCQDGWSDIVSVDYCSLVIEQMKQKYSHVHALQFDVQDVRSMTYADASFAYIIDKGTLDAVTCLENPEVQVHQMISEVFRLLRDGGRYLVITHSDPSRRLEYFRRMNWQIYHLDLNGRSMFVMIK